MNRRSGFVASAPQLPLVALIWKAPELISSFMMLFGFFSLVWLLPARIIPSYLAQSARDNQWQMLYTKCELQQEALASPSATAGSNVWGFRSYVGRVCTLWATEQTSR
jgi:hypothetical protein